MFSITTTAASQIDQQQIHLTVLGWGSPWFISYAVLIIAALIFLRIMFYKLRKAERLALKAEMRETALLTDNNTLDHLHRIKSELFQNMSHDFKTPLTVISTSVLNVTDMLEFDDIDKDEMRESLAIAQREIMRMSRMVDNAIKLPSLHDNRQDRTPIEIATLLSEGAEVYRALLKRNGNTLTTDIPATLPKIFGNADMLLQVLSNLLSNANRYTKNGEISVLAIEKCGVVAITVRDNGSGVDPDLLPHIFERGVSDNGSGLGLSICKLAIEEVHKGTISAQSTYGQGTDITFTLPIYVHRSRKLGG
ncbi:MAG: HAMP domain-containing histidine kinase [Defluviitaleaceae bacterium]|nr:HAMP domain-containing histidine kinase [Defluviitaleaceae bacterium]